ncbi:MAG: hypothetical protein R3277_13525 [Brumimicrobium sp.]|nr:hypothetical protein [Brumimicrobium sp.]
MRTIFDNMSIRHIQIEERSQNASVEVEFFQNGQMVQTTLMIDATDLNQLFAKLNAKGIDVSLSDDFNCFPTDEGMLYTLDLTRKGWADIRLDYFSPLHPVRQIRA